MGVTGGIFTHARVRLDLDDSASCRSVDEDLVEEFRTHLADTAA